MLNKYKYLFFISAAALLFGACKHGHSNGGAAGPLQYTGQTLPMNDFLAWVADADHELVKDKALTDINYKICYQPKEILAGNELKGEQYTEQQFKDACKHYEGMSYFNFRIELVKGSGELLKYDLASSQQYNERIDYLSFKMQQHIFLVQGKDTLSPGLFHFERIFEVAPFATVMLAFDDQKFDRKQEFTIVYDDGLFHKGYIKYTYSPNQLIDLPTTPGV